MLGLLKLPFCHSQNATILRYTSSSGGMSRTVMNPLINKQQFCVDKSAKSWYVADFSFT